jgi:predicted nucleic acid-binding protein
VDWVERLYGQTVCLDTSPLIYFVERDADYLPVVRPFFKAVADGRMHVVTSVLTLTEVLTRPLLQRDKMLANNYANTLRKAPGFETVPVTDAIAIDAAAIRARYRLKTPDAIQLASGWSRNATAFVTNDDDFKSVVGIDVIVLKHFLVKR